MRSRAVSWQRAALVLTAVTVALLGVVVVLRSEGFRAIDATVPRATRWFVDRDSNRVILADGFAGRALARLDIADEGQVLDIAQSASGVVVIDRSAATVRTVDPAALRLGPPQSVGIVAEPTAQVGVSPAGVVAVDPLSSRALLLPQGGDPVPYEFDAGRTGGQTRIAPDGAIWTIAGDRLVRLTTTGEDTVASGLSEPAFTLVGARSLVLDAGRGRVRFADGDWVDVPAGAVLDDTVIQEPGPAAQCGWIGSDDRLWCIGAGGIEHDVEIDGLDIDGADLLAIAGDAAALIRRAPSEIVRLDWRSEVVLDDQVADPPAGAALDVAAATDLIWVDAVDGDFVWAVHPWGISAVRKDDDSPPLLGETGELLEEGSGGRVPTAVGGDDATADVEREPDDNGIDDPPVAVDDPVTARSGTGVPIAVTANDYDPDGEAIAVSSVGDAMHGTVELATASTVLYQPAPGFVGLDEFRYTIVDGDGTEASATVNVELLPADAPNQAPIGSPDIAETGPDTAVVIDVLENDIDPERDALRVASFNPPDVGGEISETVAPSGLPALRYRPPPGASGTASFTYRPVDSFGAVGEPVAVRVEIAQPTDENRPPIVLPDAALVRRDVAFRLPVLANDRDPDGDRLSIGLVEPLPPGLDVRVDGVDLEIIARAGVRELSPFGYTVDDGRGNEVIGSVLVALISDVEPNRPPIANADSASTVVGTARTIEVLANDSDPDGDPLVLVAVERAGDTTVGGLELQGSQVRYTAPTVISDDDVAIDRFTYTISDGNGNVAIGEVTVRLLPEAVAAPPFAQDDAATTEVDVPVTLDVLRNDSDPSGERPSIVGQPGCAGGGDAAVTSDQRVTYRPPAGQSGVFSCSYEVRNSQGLRALATIVVSVLEPEISNLPPVVGDEDVIVELGEVVDVDVLANDADPDGDNDELQVLSVTRPVLGTATRDGGVVRFEAGAVVGIATITYQVGDPLGGVTTGRLVLRVVEPDPEPPFAVDDRRTITGPAAPIRIAVLANDGDPDGDVADLRLTGVDVVAGDAVALVEVDSVTIDAEPDFVGDVVVNYTIVDLDGLSARGSIVLTVLTPPNRPPIAGSDSAQVANGGTAVVPIALNDSDPDGDALTYSLVGGPDPALGAARLELGELRFEAVPGASGVATVTYRIGDGEFTADGLVTIDVLPCTASQPNAPDLFFQTGYQQPIAIDLTTSASNGDVVEVGLPLGVPSGVYTPPAGENGNVTFNYVVRNSCRIQDVGEVVIDVNQDPIVSAYQSAIGRFDQIVVSVTALATDLEPLTIVTLEGAPEWTAIVDDGRGVLLDPAGRSGRLEMTAVVIDTGGLQARVPMVVDLVNLAPVAQPDVVDVGDTVVVVDPLQNDRDPDGDALALGAVPTTLTFPNGGVATIDRVGDDQLQIDVVDGLGAASFEYTVVDSLGLVSAPATVTVVVNRSPVAPDVVVELVSGSTVAVPIPATDAEGGPLMLTVLGDPDPLEVAVDGLVAMITAPPEVEDGQFTLTYRVADPQGATSDGTLLVTVVEPAPTTTTSTSTTSTTTTVPPTTTTTTTTTTPTSTTTSTSSTTTPPSTSEP